jgi:hypothetical protein
MKTLMAIITFLVGAAATTLQENSMYWSGMGEMRLAKLNLEVSWWFTGSFVILGITFVLMMVAEIRRLSK